MSGLWLECRRLDSPAPRGLGPAPRPQRVTPARSSAPTHRRLRPPVSSAISWMRRRRQSDGGPLRGHVCGVVGIWSSPYRSLLVAAVVGSRVTGAPDAGVRQPGTLTNASTPGSEGLIKCVRASSRVVTGRSPPRSPLPVRVRGHYVAVPLTVVPSGLVGRRRCSSAKMRRSRRSSSARRCV